MIMNNIMDYLDWRGDLSFETSPFNEVDGLILSTIAYAEFDKIVTESFEDQILLRDCYGDFSNYLTDEKYSRLGVIIPEEVINLFHKASETYRFGTLRLSGYVNHVDEEAELQFAAITFQNTLGDVFVAYRGTDDTVVGWKEDFNLAVMDKIPAQEKAVEYLEEVYAQRSLNEMELLPTQNIGKRIYLMGHSKGGNLAIYAATNAKPMIKELISGVYNYDGPGFSKEFLMTDAYKSINDVTHWFLPEESMIGTLLYHGNNEYVVNSPNRGLMSHDMFSWNVLGNVFVKTGLLSKDAIVMHKIVDNVLERLTAEQTKVFISVVFDVLFANNTKTLSDINGKNFLALIDAVKTADAETKQVFHELGQLTMQTIKESR
ncbi:MAG: DUF2974 domain-containing protein [Lachnospiraceae bacterium]|nr:DUF2974 domain-containing protein [Lachnospiraceae bacterium]